MKILHLTIKKKWFNQIVNNVKKIEYREIKPYWIRRLTKNDLNNFLSETIKFKEFDVVEFHNGYTRNSPSIQVKCTLIDIGWCEEWRGNAFRIHLGKIL